MEIVIESKWLTHVSTISEMSIDGKKECFVLEDVVRPAGVKVHGKTAIPAGEYDVKMTMSNRFKKIMPLVYNNPKDLSVVDSKGVSWAGVRIHAGNTDEDTDGCLILGKNRLVNMVIDSRPVVASVYHQIETALAKGEKVKLKIIRPTV